MERRKEIMRNEILATMRDCLEEIENGYKIMYNLGKIRDCTWAYENLVGVY